MRTYLLLAATAASMIWAIPADAPHTSYEMESEFWEEHCVVYARVASVAKIRPGHVAVTLDVEAALTGHFDAAASTPLDAELSYGFGSSVGYAPRPGQHVVAVLRWQPRLDGYFIPSAKLPFMPLTDFGPPERPPLPGVKWGKTHASIVEVTGFDDPKVAEVIARLRELRAPKYEGPPEDKVLANSLGMKLVRIDAGEFLMGSPDSDKEATDREKPQHRVRITKPFYLGMYEVTQGQYEQLMGENPSHFKRRVGRDGYVFPRGEGETDPDRPVDSVTWDEAVAFCRKLSEKEGVTYRLPTEAEWEYACRAGSKLRYPFDDYPIGLGEYAFWGRISKDTTHRVGLKKPNAWGLYDMLGNVSEWCGDWFGEDYYARSPVDDPAGFASGIWRVVRGGSSYFVEPPPMYRCAHRNVSEPGDRNPYRGFRVVREEKLP